MIIIIKRLFSGFATTKFLKGLISGTRKNSGTFAVYLPIFLHQDQAEVDTKKNPNSKNANLLGFQMRLDYNGVFYYLKISNEHSNL